jgi:hypothetical protein
MSTITNATSLLGKDFPRLSGTDNFHAWSTALEPVARLNGTWDFYLSQKDGGQDVLTKPTFSFPTGTDAVTRSKDAVFQFHLEKYKFDLDEWKDNEKRVRLALAILKASVEPYVWAGIDSLPRVKTHPREAIKALTAQNKPEQAVAIERAALQLTNLKLSDYKHNIREYIHVANTQYNLIKADGGTYPRSQLVSSILNGLSARYGTFVDLTRFNTSLDNIDDEKYKTFTTKLIAYSDNHQSQWEHASTTRREKGKGNKPGGNGPKNPNGPNEKETRTCNWCQFVGHLEKDCRKKKKAVIDQGTDNPTKPDPPAPKDNSNTTKDDKRNKNSKPAGKKNISALATQEKDDDSDDDFAHIAAMSVCDDYILHSDPPSTYPLIPHLHITDLPQSNDSDRSLKVGGRNGTGIGGNDIEWEALSLQGTHRSNQAIALLGDRYTSVPRHEWVADTAASTHICNNRSLFTSLTNRESTIGSCDNSTTLAVHGYGPVTLTFTTPCNKHVAITLSRVSYAPNSRCNLISIPQLTDKAGISFYGDKTRLVLVNEQGRDFAVASRKHRLFCFQLQLQLPNPTPPTGSIDDIAAAAVDFDDKVWKKHRELGHLSIEGMRKLNKIADGLGLTDQQLKAKLLDVCPICATSKALNRIPREPARRHYQNLGDLLHIDIWGPYPILGLNGERYAIFETDDATRHTWVDFLITKDTAASTLKRRFKNIQITHNFSVRRIRTDNEFLQNIINNLCKEEGITHEVTVPYAHWQNGVAERLNRTVREIASAQIQDNTPTPRIAAVIGRATELQRTSNLPEGLWTESIREAVWKKNRSPTKALKFKKTPYEALTGLRPNLSCERAWGTRVYVTIPPEKRLAQSFTKLHTPRAYLAYFVSTESESILRVWDPERQKVARVTATRVDASDVHDHQPGQDLNTRLPETHTLQAQNADHDSDTDSEPDFAAMATDYGPYYDDEEDIPKDATVLSHHFAPSTDEPLRSKRAPHLLRETPGAAAQKAITFELCQYLATHPDQDLPSLVTAIQALPETSPAIKAYRRRPLSQRMRTLRIDFFSPTATAYDQVLWHFKYLDRKKILDLLENQGIPIPRLHEDAHTALVRAELHGLDTPLSDKCYKCFIRGLTCGDRDEAGNCPTCPDDHCRTINNFMTQMKCIHCSRHRAWCRGRPCARCTQKGRNCQDFDVDTGTLTRHWTRPEDTPAEDTENCDLCLRTKRNCKGYDGGPCYNCGVKYRHTTPIGCFGPPLHICGYSNIGNSTGVAYLLDAYEWRDENEDNVRYLIPYTPKDSDLRRITKAFKWGLRHWQTENDLHDTDSEDDLDDDILDDDVLDDDLTHDRPRNQTPQDDGDSDAYDDEGLSDSDLHDLAMASLELDDPENADTDEDITYYNEHEYPNNGDDDLDTDTQHYALTTTTHHEDRLPRNYAEAMKLPDAREYHAATMKEFAQLKERGVYEVVPLPPGKRALSTKLVYKKKYRPTGEVKKYKARCVARGFLQKKGQDYEDSWAGTANPTAIRVLIALAISYGWTRHQIDITTAYLYALLAEETYARPPPPIQLPKGHVWRVRRALYGLCQSGRAWFHRLKGEMVTLGFRQSPYDPCIYIHKTKPLIVSVVVDDLSIFTPNRDHTTWFKSQLSHIFNITEEDEDCTYLGMQIQQDQGCISLHQSTYTRTILDRYDFRGLAPTRIPAKPGLKLTKNTATDVNTARQKLYLEKYGSLNYLPTMTRPDLAYSLSLCGRYMANPTQEHMDALDTVYAYLKATPHIAISYRKGTPSLEGYVDADWVGCLDTRRSTTGYVFTFAGGPVSWSSKRQNIVALSTTEAEYIAAGEAVKEALWLKRFVNDLSFEGYNISSVPVNVDNKSAIALTKNPIGHQRTKHIDARHHFIRDVIEDGHVTIKWISGKDNIADMFTKALPRASFEEFKKRLNLR